MSDDKGDNITEPADKVTTTTQPEAAPSEASAQADAAKTENKLGGLMADAEAPAQAPKKPGVDLEGEAMRAAEQALAQGEQALATAREQLKQEPATESANSTSAPKPKAGSGRELALRILLAVNVAAMVVVAMLPAPDASTEVDPVTPGNEAVESVTPKTVAARMSEPWNRAMRASEQRDFVSAVTILEQYLEDNARMPESERLSVLSALSFYATRSNQFKKSREYSQKAQALEQSHYLPEDLVKMAEAALASGDQESLRRHWARFLLQQQQVPSWLYQHVAQAYLQLGDSYRIDANTETERARRLELAEATARLRAESMQQGGGK